MNDELKAYFGIQAKLAAAFNFFISGMVAALIHHKADYVATDAISLIIDYIITCLLIFTITAFFVRAGLKSTKTIGILEPKNRLDSFLARRFRSPLGYGVLAGFAVAVVLSAIIAPIAYLLDIAVLPFYPYVFLKAVFCMLVGAFAAISAMYAGMCKTE